MLSAKTQYSLSNAKDYFEEHLSAGDYYTKGEQLSGEWIGTEAEHLGLSGSVKSSAFLDLCDNVHPHTGERLTARLKTIRTDLGADGNPQINANRRVFYDFTISPPKSVSIVALIGKDHRVVTAHDHAVRVAIRELERFAATRVHHRNRIFISRSKHPHQTNRCSGRRCNTGHSMLHQ